MKQLTTLITILFISFLSSPSWSETVSMDELVERNGLYYKKFTDVPYSGEVGNIFKNGKFKAGMKEGYWREYNGDGSLGNKEHFRKGKLDGRSEYYYYNGQSIIENHIDGKLNGRWEWYYDNGKLQELRILKDGKLDGILEYFNYDGSLRFTETWKNGVKQ